MPASGRITVNEGPRTIRAGSAHSGTTLRKRPCEVIEAMHENELISTQRAPAPRVDDAAVVDALADAGFTDAREIGQGGFGVVYRCRQESLDRTVAVKVLRTTLDPDNLERFLREQRAMGRVSGHPNICNVLQAGTIAENQPYLVMHYHPHDSLETRIRRHGALPWPEAVRIGIKVAGALETAHRADVLHRDIKPGNILVTEYGAPQLTDFGIAHVGGGFRTTSGTITGSPAFTAPEVLRGGDPTPASDVYGLAATLFCAITGHAAFERKEGERVVAQFVRITSEPVPDLRGSGIPDDVCAALESGMAPDPAERPATAAEFGEMLRRIQWRHGLKVDDMALPGGPPPEPTDASGTESPNVTYPVTRVPSPSTAPATRFHPPVTTRPLVARTRLLRLLRTGQHRRLTAIHAPTGFGKSTLAAQWQDVLTAEGVPVAWLTVVSDDNKVLWFLAHLIEAVKQVRPALARDLEQILQSHGDDATRYVLSTLIDEIYRTGEPMTLVVDDWQRVTSRETVAALDFLLEQGPPNLHVVVTSRRRTGLPLSRLRVRDELLEIDSTALRFDDQESEQFLRDVGGLHLTPDDVRELNNTTEGWAAALQLASLSLRDSDDPSTLIENLTGRHHAIGEYLADNVLSTLEPEMYEFLSAISVAQSICAGLAIALTGEPRSQAMLEDAEQRDLFLRHVDDDRVWFRFHHMFRDFLRRRLERDHPERVPELHRAAARWCAEHDLLRESVDHALAAGDTAFAVDLVASDGMDLMEHGHMGTLLALIDKLPPRAVADDPRLLLSRAWADGALQRFSEARSALAAIPGLCARSTLPPDDLDALLVESRVAEASLLMNTDHVEGIEELVEPVLTAPDEARPWVVGAATVFACYADLLSFEFDSVRRRQKWARPYHERTRGQFAAIYGLCLCGIAANEQLDVAAAEDYFRRAMRAARQSGGIHTHAGRLSAAMLGELMYEQGRTAEAETLLDESKMLGIEGGIADFMMARFATGARLKMLRGDRQAAVALLDEGLRAASTHDLPRLRARIENERMRLGIEPRLTPRRTMPDPETRPPVGPEEVTAQFEDATAIRILYRTGEPGAVAEAVEWARWWQRRTAGRRPRTHMSYTRLVVACLHAAGRQEEAERTVAPLVALCGERGMVRHLIDGGPRVVAVLESLQDRVRNGSTPKGWPIVDEAFLAEMVRLAEEEGAGTRL